MTVTQKQLPAYLHIHSNERRIKRKKKKQQQQTKIPLRIDRDVYTTDLIGYSTNLNRMVRCLYDLRLYTFKVKTIYIQQA